MAEPSTKGYLTLIIAIITIVGSSFPFVVSTLYTQIFNKPSLYSEIHLLDRTQLVYIENTGMASATNVSIKLDATVKISNITNLQSIEKFNIVFPKLQNSE